MRSQCQAELVEADLIAVALIIINPHYISQSRSHDLFPLKLRFSSFWLEAKTTSQRPALFYDTMHVNMKRMHQSPVNL